MTPQELATDLRSRINPAYAATLGTESYERRLVCEALEAQAAEIERLRSALAKAGDLLFDVWNSDGETEAFHMRYSAIQQAIVLALDS